MSPNLLRGTEMLRDLHNEFCAGGSWSLHLSEVRGKQEHEPAQRSLRISFIDFVALFRGKKKPKQGSH